MAKSTAESAKNVINITKTISERQQMRAVSVFYHGMFNSRLYELPNVVLHKKDIIDESDFNTNLKSFMSSNDLVCSSIIVRNQMYKTEDLVVLDIADCDNVSVGLIKTILIKDDKVYFVVKRYGATRNWLQYFESEKPDDNICEFVESKNIKDSKPLIKRGTSNNFVFTFHHHVSYEYQ